MEQVLQVRYSCKTCLILGFELLAADFANSFIFFITVHFKK
jgi:hypothetical protein